MNTTPRLQSVGLLLATLVVLPIYYVCIAASVDMRYEAVGVTFSQAFEKAISTPLVSVIQDDHAFGFHWFFPFSILACVALAWLGDDRSSNWVLLGAILIPLVVSPMSILVGMKFPIYLAFSQDGETWGEGWPVASAIGFWVVAALLLFALRWLPKSRTKDETQIG